MCTLDFRLKVSTKLCVSYLNKYSKVAKLSSENCPELISKQIYYDLKSPNNLLKIICINSKYSQIILI